jgi:hypothetical protein
MFLMATYAHVLVGLVIALGCMSAQAQDWGEELPQPTPDPPAPTLMSLGSEAEKASPLWATCSQSTELNEDKADADYIKATGCGLNRKVKCPLHRSLPRNSKGKALVLYMMHLPEHDDRAPEWGNVMHFFRFGLLPKSQPTQLFDSVDFIFMRPRRDVTNITVCNKYENVKMVFVPLTNCDLCTHAQMLQYLGYKTEYSSKLSSNWPYKSVVMMNSGVRGPFMSPNSSSWIDVASMAGQPSRPVRMKKDFRFGTVASITFSWDGTPHIQSYWLTLPLTAIAYYYTTFLAVCGSTHTKDYCIKNGEFKTAPGPLLSPNGSPLSIFSFHRNVTIRGTDNLEEVRLRVKQDKGNPSCDKVDPCKTMFRKFGGEGWTAYPWEDKKKVYRLTMYMTLQQLPLFTDLDKLFASSGTCRWFRSDGQISTEEPATQAPLLKGLRK